MKLQTACKYAAQMAMRDKHVACVVHDGIDDQIRIVSTERLLDSPFRYSVIAKVFPACGEYFDDLGFPKKEGK